MINIKIIGAYLMPNWFDNLLYWFLLTSPYEEDSRNTVEIEIELKDTEYVESVEIRHG